MRHLLLLLACYLLTLPLARAQFGTIGGGSEGATELQAPRTAFADSINAVFQYLDKSRVPSGILEDYGLQVINHAPFTGTTGHHEVDSGLPAAYFSPW